MYKYITHIELEKGPFPGTSDKRKLIGIPNITTLVKTDSSHLAWGLSKTKLIF